MKLQIFQEFCGKTHGFVVIEFVKLPDEFDNYLVQLIEYVPNFTNPEYFVCLLFKYFFHIKVLS